MWPVTIVLNIEALQEEKRLKEAYELKDDAIRCFGKGGSFCKLQRVVKLWGSAWKFKS